jgi:membrane-associated protease RseP (regulator of RpoE activity)
MENVIYSIVAAVIGLGVLIVIHEFGHFLFAKLSA